MAKQKSNDYYKMRMIVDKVATQVAKAHMMHTEFILDTFEYANVSIFDKNKKLLYGNIIQDIDFTKHQYMHKDVFVVIIE